MCNPFHMKGIILDGYALNPGDLSFDCLKAIADFEVYGFTSPDLVIERCCDKEIVITNKVVFSKDVIQQQMNAGKEELPLRIFRPTAPMQWHSTYLPSFSQSQTVSMNMTEA